MQHPTIIQGGMGIGVSGWELARAVSTRGQLGVLSGAGAHVVMSRILQLGDEGGHYRHALEQFPDQAMVGRILTKYFVDGSIASTASFQSVPQFTVDSCREIIELTIAANFSQVWLAKNDHAGVVGVNFLEKMQLPMLYALYGALLAGVDYILIGAGVPNQIPEILEKLVRHQAVEYQVYIPGDAADVEKVSVHFNPVDFFPGKQQHLAIPQFFPIVASASLAQALMRSGRIDGFVIEGPTAGGHNAPPRGKLQLSATGEPVYGEKDAVDFDRLRKLERPFWLAGGYASPEGLRAALVSGAAGIQAGTLFALCEESLLADDLKWELRRAGFRGEQRIFTDPQGSPTGFPFKVAQVGGTLSDPVVYEDRERACDLQGLQQLYRRCDGAVRYRCPAEPVATFTAKGGVESETVGRKCLCNALLANIGLAQRRDGGHVEPPLVTLGDDLRFLRALMADEVSTYTAEDALKYLLSQR